MAISEDRFELNLERAAHRETRAHLARMTQAVQYWHARATNNGLDRMAQAAMHEQPIPTPLPIPTPTPAGGGDGGGGQLLVVVCELMEAAAQMASQLALQQGGVPPSPELGGWVTTVQTKARQLVAALPAGTGTTGATPTGGHRGYPPTQPQNPGPQKKQGEHQNNPPPP
jgi:hypothetical protein